MADRPQELDATWPTRIKAVLSSRVQGRPDIPLASFFSIPVPASPHLLSRIAMEPSFTVRAGHASTPLELERSHALHRHCFS
jgi:hypothetical protein